ncbi:MAG: TonB-dependent receptor [Crocinitomicaceae bacterium]|nr:TonB-dependent receptor [Crocinitomicaceae bacterium]
MKAILFILAAIISCSAVSQTATVSGVVTDNVAKQPVVGAKVIFSDKYKAYSDYDGNYTINDVPFGEYDVIVTMLSFDTVRMKVNVDSEQYEMSFILGGSQEIEEVNVIGNLAQDRKTPVAVSNIGTREINEELGSQDLPMILNSKPGVHATQQGGGDGDARITIRGFDQRNVGVMIDGVPVNDMENGAVYWSNWFGLDAITQQIQVQRGLGATKLAMPSVGGTMNILTQNTGGKREIKVRQEYGSGTFLRTSLSYKSGTLKNGWGVLFSGSYKQGNGWVDGLNTQGGFYYLKVQKKIKNHVVSLSGFGAPQQHGQRSYNQQIQYWDKDLAQEQYTGHDEVYNLVTAFNNSSSAPDSAAYWGRLSDFGINHGNLKSYLSDNNYIDTTGAENWGPRHNQHWGTYHDSLTGKNSARSERRNFYHKPQITLKDFWKINNKLSWSNMAYVSIGRGGGQSIYNSNVPRDSVTDEILWAEIEYSNQWNFSGGPTIEPKYDPSLLKSSQILMASMNNHTWVGGLSQFDYEFDSKLSFAGGLDYRYYKGTHYTEIVDLLGGDYFIDGSNKNATEIKLGVGDKIAKYPYQSDRAGFVQWAGAFGQAEYSHGRWTAFLNLSGVSNGYRGEDYFQKKTMQVGDSLIEIGTHVIEQNGILNYVSDTVTLDGVNYTTASEGLETSNTGWKWLFGGTIKAGANFNVTEKSNVFMNLGYLSRTPQYSNVVDNNTNQFFEEILNENIYAFELGYGFRSKKLSVNFNGYYTYWENKPFPYGVSIPDPQDPTEFIRANVNGMDALHVGAEVDASYRVSKKWSIEGMVSYGDWTWQSTEIVDVLGTEFEFDAKGVHVGDAAQSTYAASIRYAFVKNGYLKVKYSYFDRYYSDFDPFSLTGANGGTESWEIPSYGLMSIHAGYRLRFEKSSLNFRANVFNALNTLYISDARTNKYGTDFSASSAGVFVGQGLRFNVSLGFQF